MIYNTRNPFIFVVCLLLSNNACAEQWINWEPVKEKLSHGADAIVGVAEKVKNTFIRKKEEIEKSLQNDVAKTQNISLAGVDTLKISGTGSVVITQNKKADEALVIECAQGEIPELDIRVEDNVLVVVLKDKASLLSGKLTYRVNVSELSYVELADTVSVEFSDIDVAQLSIRASGSCQIVGEIVTEKLTLDSADTCKVALSGSAKEQIVKMSGKGTFDGSGLIGRSMVVDSCGTCHISSNVSDRIEGTILDVGSLSYANGPIIDVDSSQKSCVRKI